MPLYEYDCPQCRQTFEELAPASRNADTATCPACGAAHARKRMSTFAGRMGQRRTTSAPAGGCATGACCFNGACQ